VLQRAGHLMQLPACAPCFAGAVGPSQLGPSQGPRLGQAHQALARPRSQNARERTAQRSARMSTGVRSHRTARAAAAAASVANAAATRATRRHGGRRPAGGPLGLPGAGSPAPLPRAVPRGCGPRGSRAPPGPGPPAPAAGALGRRAARCALRAPSRPASLWSKALSLAGTHACPPLCCTRDRQAAAPCSERGLQQRLATDADLRRRVGRSGIHSDILFTTQ